MRATRTHSVSALLVVVALAAAPSSAWAAVTLPPNTIPLPTIGSFLYVNSESGDPIGGGVERLFTTANSKIEAAFPPNWWNFSATIRPTSALGWSVSLSAPLDETLHVGSYTNAQASRGVDEPGMWIAGNGYGCNTITGQFDVVEISYSSYGDLLLFDATFEQHCGGIAPALYGRIRIDQPAPVRGVTLPAGTLTLPTSGTFLYVLSQAGDPVGGGVERLYTLVDSTIHGQMAGESRFIGSSYDWSVGNSWAGDSWIVGFTAADGQRLAVGSYVITLSYPAWFEPEMYVSRFGSGCSSITGKFDVDELSFWPTGELRVFDAKFEQRCHDYPGELFGRMRIDNPPPAPALELAITIDTEPTVNVKTGLVTVTGTLSCSRTAAVDMSGYISELVQNEQSIMATLATHVYCAAPSTRWTATVLTSNPQFTPNVARVTLLAESCDSRCYLVPSAATVHLNAGTARP